MAKLSGPCDAYYLFRMFINCKGGGYVEDVNLSTTPTAAGAAPDPGALAQCAAIAQLRGYMLEGNSRIANMVLSRESAPGNNPPEGFELQHAMAGVPTQLTSLITSEIEDGIELASDPAQAIQYQLNTYQGVIETRTIRSVRASWISMFGALLPTITFPNAPTDAAPDGTVPGPTLGQYMGYIRDNSVLIQKTPTLGSPFNAMPFPTAVIAGVTPIPITVTGTTRKKVGYGWPKTRGRKATFS